MVSKTGKMILGIKKNGSPSDGHVTSTHAPKGFLNSRTEHVHTMPGLWTGCYQHSWKAQICFECSVTKPWH
eukprot:scaffold45730_cov20-Tisochrysis_lutea.AAC.2